MPCRYHSQPGGMCGAESSTSEEAFETTIEKMMAAAETVTKRMEAKQRRNRDRRQKFIDAFNAFDLDGSGELSKAEFQYVGEAMHPDGWTKKQTKHLLRCMDDDGDGLVELDEFLQYYRTVIYDATDEHFEDGLEVFKTAAAAMQADRAAALEQRAELKVKCQMAEGEVERLTDEVERLRQENQEKEKELVSSSELAVSLKGDLQASKQEVERQHEAAEAEGARLLAAEEEVKRVKEELDKLKEASHPYPTQQLQH